MVDAGGDVGVAVARAEERARNLVTALMFPMPPIRRRDVVKATLDVPAIMPRSYGAAVRAADEAFRKAIKGGDDE